jgi:hypothetical protein
MTEMNVTVTKCYRHCKYVFQGASKKVANRLTFQPFESVLIDHSVLDRKILKNKPSNSLDYPKNCIIGEFMQKSKLE